MIETQPRPAIRRLRRAIVGLLALVLLVVANGAVAADPYQLRIVAAEFAPLQMNVDGEVKGYVVELVERVVERVRSETPIETTPIKLLPWRRAMRLTEREPNVAFFSLSRTAEREEKFIWVGEVSPYEIYFFKLRNRQDVTADSLFQIRQSPHLLGVQAGSNMETLLKGMGFDKGRDYITYRHYKRGIAMLFKGRFTMLPLTSFVARSNVCLEGYPGDDIEPVVRVDTLSKPLWMALSKGTPPTLAVKLRSALEALKQDGTAGRIREGYLADHQSRSCAAK